ncbi:hypothetical protein EZS27_000747 [termite gut metagenome]|uniref:Uncharacterized protein n=1 Tax=termite gut metagenome TaxID=433724 RepID=A0A5J4T3B2_9ZZZZ
MQQTLCVIFMDTVQLNVERNQFYGLLQTLDNSDKMEIYKFLKKLLFRDRMENLLESLKTNELSMEDITEVVEEVRQERYDRGIQNT